MDIKVGQTWKNKRTGEEYKVTFVRHSNLSMSDGYDYSLASLREYWTLVRDVFPRGPIITLVPIFGASEQVYAREATPDQLYDALEAWGPERNYGRTRSEAATQFRIVANPILKAIRAELRRRGLPKERQGARDV